MKKIFVILCTFLLTTCSKEIYIVEKPVTPPTNLPPGEFELEIIKISDVEISLKWNIPSDPENEKLTYELAVNDSVIAYDLKINSYKIGKLNPDTDYSVSVIAVDSHRNKKIVNKSVHTMKSLIDKFISFDTYNRDYIFLNAIETLDNGYLVYGWISEIAEDNKLFLLKLKSDFSISWKKEYGVVGNNFYEEQLIECSDHNYIIVYGNTVLKINNEGNVIWNYNSDENTTMFFHSIVENSDGNFFLAGSFFNATLPGIDNLCNEYFLIKLDSQGQELSRQIGETGFVNREQHIYLDNSNLFLYGNCNDELTLRMLDMDGQQITVCHYLNQYNFKTEHPFSLKPTIDNNYILLSTINGSIGAGNLSNLPRFLKIRRDGIILWDQYHYLTSDGFGPALNGIDILDNGQYLVLINDDRGLSIVLLNSMGSVENHIKLYGFSQGMSISLNNQGKYVYFSVSGEIVIINPDGYNE